MLASPHPQFRLDLDRFSGADAIRETLKLMRLLVLAGKIDPQVRAQAVSLVSACRQKDYGAEIACLFDFVQNEIRYVRDPAGWEALHAPRAVLEIGAGDCDDKSILLAALLESLDHPTQFVAVGFCPGALDHVYVETAWPGSRLRAPGHNLALDATEPRGLGWAPPNPRELMVMPNCEAVQ